MIGPPGVSLTAFAASVFPPAIQSQPFVSSHGLESLKGMKFSVFFYLQPLQRVFQSRDCRLSLMVSFDRMWTGRGKDDQLLLQVVPLHVRETRVSLAVNCTSKMMFVTLIIANLDSSISTDITIRRCQISRPAIQDSSAECLQGCTAD